MLTTLTRAFISLDNWIFQYTVPQRYLILNGISALFCILLALVIPSEIQTQHKFLLGLALTPIATLVSNYHLAQHKKSDGQFITSLLFQALGWIVALLLILWIFPTSASILGGLWGWTLALPFSWSNESRFLEN